MLEKQKKKTNKQKIWFLSFLKGCVDTLSVGLKEREREIDRERERVKNTLAKCLYRLDCAYSYKKCLYVGAYLSSDTSGIL